MTDNSDSINEIAQALAKAQTAMEHADKGRKNSHLGNRYSTLADVLDACRPHLSANGIAIVQTPAITDSLVSVRTSLIHSSGQWLACTLSAPLGENKGVTRVQAIGSAMTYLRRYSLAALTSVASDDDDGEGARAPQHREPERRPEPKPTTWSDDDRAEYLEALAKMPEVVTEALVDDWQQSKDKPIAASMTPDTRRAFVAYLASAKGLEAITAYAKTQEKA